MLDLAHDEPVRLRPRMVDRSRRSAEAAGVPGAWTPPEPLVMPTGQPPEMAQMADERQRDPVSRSLEALSWIICEAGPSFGVREMAGALGIPPSAAHRALTALALKGLVRQDGNGRYLIGMETYRLAQVALGRFPLKHIAMPHLQHLVDACDETVLLGVFDPDRVQMIFAAAVESNSPLRYAVRLNEWVPLHLGASGLGILAFLPAQARALAIARAGEGSDDKAFASKLEARIEKVREDGFAHSFAQRVEGAVGFAAPIFSPSGLVMGDVCITLPEQRYTDERREWLADAVKQCANAISRSIQSPGF